MVIRQKKRYTLEEANRSLPLVRAIVSDYVELHRNVTELRERLSAISASRHNRQGDVYSEEVDVAARRLVRDESRLAELVEELKQLSLEIGEDGSVDFPGEMFGREVLFSWHVGETEVAFFRDPAAKAKGRMSLSDTGLLAKKDFGGTLRP